MATKAVLIHTNNIKELTSRFQHEGTGVPLAIGYYLVAGFGEDGDYDVVSSVNFFSRFTKGDDLQNEFFEAIPKVVENG